MPFAVAFVALWRGGHSPRDILARQVRKGA